MANITLPEFGQLSPKMQELLKPGFDEKGNLGETVRLLALREDVFFSTTNMATAYLFSNTELPFPTKERIAILVSMENSCKICVDAHRTLAKQLGMSEEQVQEAVAGIDKIDCEETEKTLLRFCLRASGRIPTRF